MDLSRTNWQTWAWSIYFKREKHICSREFYSFFSNKIWKIYHTYPYSDGGTGNPQAFNVLYLTYILFSPFREKYDWKEDPVFKIEVNLLIIPMVVQRKNSI